MLDIFDLVGYNEHRRQGRGTASGDGNNGSIAQLGEHLPYKQGVTGSSPVNPTNYINAAW